MSEEFLGIPLTLENLLVGFLQMIPSLVAALVVFIIGLVGSMLIVRALRIALNRREVKPEAVIVIVRITYISLITLTCVIALQQIGFNLTAFLAGLGILGFTVGFALQDVSKNFVAGLLLLVQQPFEIGETIGINEYVGVVQEIDLRATSIRSLDGRIVMIPNGDVFTSPITNYTRAEFRRVDIQLGVSGDSDLELVRSTAMAAIRDIPGLVDDPEPKVSFHTFGDFSINLTLFYWIDTSKTSPADAKDAGIDAVNSAFISEKISTPYPTQTVLMQSV